MLLFICHVLLFAAKFIQAAPQKVKDPPKKFPVFDCNVILDWNGTPTTVIGRALLLPKIFEGARPTISCPRGFHVPGLWDRSHDGALPDCCVTISCGGVHGVKPGFCTGKDNCLGKFTLPDEHTCPGKAGYACCMNTPVPPIFQGNLGEGSEVEAMVPPEQFSQNAVEPYEGATLPSLEVPTTQSSFLNSGYPLLGFDSPNPQISTLNSKISNPNLGLFGNSEETFQAANMGSDSLDCMSRGTCFTLDTDISSV